MTTGRIDEETAMTDEAEELRAAVARSLGTAAFPGDAAAIQAPAAEHDASEEVRRTLARLPEDRTYASVEEVLRAVDAP